jgi:hypothetical protein
MYVLENLCEKYLSDTYISVSAANCDRLLGIVPVRLLRDKSLQISKVSD